LKTPSDPKVPEKKVWVNSKPVHCQKVKKILSEIPHTSSKAYKNNIKYQGKCKL
jgi:hypothetical protein